MPTVARRLVPTVMTAVVLALGAATVDARTAPPDEPAPAETAPPDTTPPDTSPPDTNPADTNPADTSPDTGEGSDGDSDVLTWVVVGSIALGVFGLAAAAFSSLGRRRPSSSAAEATLRDQTSILNGAQWFHDHLSIELLSAPPAAAVPRWNVERQRVDQLVAASIRQSSAPDDLWQMLAGSLTQLVSAVDTALGVRSQTTVTPAQANEVTQVASRRRDELQTLLVAMWPLVRR